jgi:hypothetical protein
MEKLQTKINSSVVSVEDRNYERKKKGKARMSLDCVKIRFVYTYKAVL